ncbi:tetratricopeptide repeat protein [Vreelandella massiliensis]|uniref:tetratricopeptide repeat protein n=1 Tax=Vreelandella massiliensis TaxID=1816686 RepID=UPI00096A3F32|nr:tetratricopeptide repeat protein [Halomonas massiliensis]
MMNPIIPIFRRAALVCLVALPLASGALAEDSKSPYMDQVREIWKSDGNLKQAYQILQRGVEAGEINSIYWMGYSHLHNNNLPEGVTAIFAKGLDLMEQAANDGIQSAQHQLAEAYIKPGSFQSIDKVIYWYTQAAEAGSGFAYYKLGHLYRRGDVVERDMKKAVEYMRLAHEHGDSSARNSLANMYSMRNQNPYYNRVLSGALYTMALGPLTQTNEEMLDHPYKRKIFMGYLNNKYYLSPEQRVEAESLAAHWSYGDPLPTEEDVTTFP